MAAPTAGDQPAPPPASDDKADWRRWARELPPVGRDIAHSVADHLVRFLAGVEGTVLAYVALPDEVDIDRICRPGVLQTAVALPRIGPDGRLAVHLDDGPRERHAHGILQPGTGATSVAPAEIGAVLVPGRVFDRRGYRLGRGSGHYDRLLPDIVTAAAVVGVACTARLVERLPREAHDIPMTHLATEDGVFSTK